jgi:hypothetical protein
MPWSGPVKRDGEFDGGENISLVGIDPPPVYARTQ